MANEIAIRIKNLPEIKAAFDRSPSLMTRELNKAIQKSIFSIGRKSRINTPVLTGRLRASTLEKFDNLRGEVGTHTNYDVFVHEGTRYMKSRPYLRQAVMSSNKAVQEFFTNAVQNVLDEIGKNV